MTNPDEPHYVEVRAGDQTVAAAEVTCYKRAGGTVRTSLYPSWGMSLRAAAPGWSIR